MHILLIVYLDLLLFFKDMFKHLIFFPSISGFKNTLFVSERSELSPEGTNNALLLIQWLPEFSKVLH